MFQGLRTKSNVTQWVSLYIILTICACAIGGGAASASTIYSTLPSSPDDWYDNYQITGDKGIGLSFNSGSNTSLDSVTFNLRGAGPLTVNLWLNTNDNLPNFTDGPVASLGSIPDDTWGSNTFYTLTLTGVSLLTDTEYWITLAPVVGQSNPWWVATFLTIPAVAQNAIGVTGQYTEINGTSYAIASSDAFEMQVNASGGSEPVPEPASMGVLGVAFAGLLAARRRNGARLADAGLEPAEAS